MVENAGLLGALGVLSFMWLFMAFIFGLFIFLFVFWILMLVDCARRKFKKSDEQIVWILVIALVGFIGALIYYFVIKRKDNKKTEEN